MTSLWALGMGIWQSRPVWQLDSTWGWTFCIQRLVGRGLALPLGQLLGIKEDASDSSDQALAGEMLPHFYMLLGHSLGCYLSSTFKECLVPAIPKLSRPWTQQTSVYLLASSPLDPWALHGPALLGAQLGGGWAYRRMYSTMKASQPWEE